MFRTLAVENDREISRAVCAFLNQSGYEAAGCLSANKAYDAMYENVFDLIVSDIMMPHIDGFEYNGILIYAMAAYTFYITAAALASMLSPETAMFSQLSKDMSHENQQFFVILTGAGVSAAIITMSVYSIVKKFKRNKYAYRERYL